MTETSTLIAEQNDEFRRNLCLLIPKHANVKGLYSLTQGFENLDELTQSEAINSIRDFDNFNHDNDPHGEHDFGKLNVNANDILWKIDYYDTTYHYGSEDPSNPTKTRRILTVMLAHEY